MLTCAAGRLNSLEYGRVVDRQPSGVGELLAVGREGERRCAIVPGTAVGKIIRRHRDARVDCVGLERMCEVRRVDLPDPLVGARGEDCLAIGSERQSKDLAASDDRSSRPQSIIVVRARQRIGRQVVQVLRVVDRRDIRQGRRLSVPFPDPEPRLGEAMHRVVTHLVVARGDRCAGGRPGDRSQVRARVGRGGQCLQRARVQDAERAQAARNHSELRAIRVPRQRLQHRVSERRADRQLRR